MIMRMSKRYPGRIAFTIVVFTLVALVCAGVSQALAAYPEKGKTIQVIVPWGAGGSTDVQTRIVTEFMKKDLNTNMELIYKPGAGSQIGLQALATSKPDG